MTNSEIRVKAHEQTRGNILTLFLVSLVWVFITVAAMALPGMLFSSQTSSIWDGIGTTQTSDEAAQMLADLAGALSLFSLLAMVISVLLGGIMEFGQAANQRRMFKNEGATLEAGFEGFKRPGSSIATYFMRSLYLFLWALIPIVGIFIAIAKSYSYACAMFIVQEDKDKKIGANEAITESRNMMFGKKFQMFCLDLYYFFVWYLLLGMITFGIAYIWGMPRHMQARYNLYQEAKTERERQVQ